LVQSTGKDGYSEGYFSKWAIRSLGPLLACIRVFSNKCCRCYKLEKIGSLSGCSQPLSLGPNPFRVMPLNNFTACGSITATRLKCYTTLWRAKEPGGPTPAKKCANALDFRSVQVPFPPEPVGLIELTCVISWYLVQITILNN
jgi:hypothetical protein